MFKAIGFERDVSNGTQRVETALALVLGDVTEGVPRLRIHSQCFTGEVLGSLRCDCHDQLEMAMQFIADEGSGLVIYEYQEGRGIGLMAKLEAYELQDAGLDTVEANHALGFKADCRDFSLPAAILGDLGIKRVRLLSNNPRKAGALIANGIEVVAQLNCEAAPNPHSLAYLRTKKERMGRVLTLQRSDATRARRIASDMPASHGGDHERAVGVAALKLSSTTWPACTETKRNAMTRFTHPEPFDRRRQLPSMNGEMR
jgi:GTP cyclohydrolase II